MTYQWLDEYCLGKTGAITDYQPDWEAERYLVGGKMFGMKHKNKIGEPVITLKLEPSFGDFLRSQYADIGPGYYMNKLHWNSLKLEGDVPDAVLKEMIDQSHHLVFKSLTKKLQKELLN